MKKEIEKLRIRKILISVTLIILLFLIAKIYMETHSLAIEQVPITSQNDYVNVNTDSIDMTQVFLVKEKIPQNISILDDYIYIIDKKEKLEKIATLTEIEYFEDFTFEKKQLIYVPKNLNGKEYGQFEYIYNDDSLKKEIFPDNQWHFERKLQDQLVFVYLYNNTIEEEKPLFHYEAQKSETKSKVNLEFTKQEENIKTNRLKKLVDIQDFKYNNKYNLYVYKGYLNIEDEIERGYITCEDILEQAFKDYTYSICLKYESEENLGKANNVKIYFYDEYIIYISNEDIIILDSSEKNINAFYMDLAKLNNEDISNFQKQDDYVFSIEKPNNETSTQNSESINSVDSLQEPATIFLED